KDPPCRNVRWRAALVSASRLSIQTLDDRAVDREARAPKRRSTWPSDQLVLNKGENLELLAHLSPEPLVDGILGPFEQLRIPVRAVIERDGWDSTQDVVWPKAVGKICRQPLPQWIVAASRFRSISADEDTLDGAGETVIVTQQKVLH